jgi:hypothetical protein
VVKTNHPKQPAIKMAITGRSVGPISLMPNQVFFSRVSSDKGATRVITMWVRGHDSTSFTVQSAPRQLKVAVVPVEDSGQATDPDARAKRYRITVSVPPHTPPGQITGTIVLKTDHPSAAEMQIPVRITVQAAG